MVVKACEKCGQSYIQVEELLKCPACEQARLDAIQAAWFTQNQVAVEEAPTGGQTFHIREKSALEQRVSRIISKTPSNYPIPEHHWDELALIPIGDREELSYSINIAISLLGSHLNDLHRMKAALGKSFRPGIARSVPTLRLADFQRGDIVSIWNTDRRNYFYVLQVDDDLLFTVKLTSKRLFDKRASLTDFGWSHRFSEKHLAAARIEERGISREAIQYEGVVSWSNK